MKMKERERRIETQTDISSSWLISKNALVYISKSTDKLTYDKSYIIVILCACVCATL